MLYPVLFQISALSICSTLISVRLFHTLDFSWIYLGVALSMEGFSVWGASRSGSSATSGFSRVSHSASSGMSGFSSDLSVTQSSGHFVSSFPVSKRAWRKTNCGLLIWSLSLQWPLILFSPLLCMDVGHTAGIFCFCSRSSSAFFKDSSVVGQNCQRAHFLALLPG